MAKVTGPLMSISASGTIGKSLTYGVWKGVQWCREWFKPSNPQSTNQVNVRTAWTLLVAEYQTETQARKDAYDVFGVPLQMSGFNVYMSRGMKEYIVQITASVTPASVAVDDTDPPSEVWTWT